MMIHRPRFTGADQLSSANSSVRPFRNPAEPTTISFAHHLPTLERCPARARRLELTIALRCSSLIACSVVNFVSIARVKWIGNGSHRTTFGHTILSFTVSSRKRSVDTVVTVHDNLSGSLGKCYTTAQWCDDESCHAMSDEPFASQTSASHPGPPSPRSSISKNSVQLRPRVWFSRHRTVEELISGGLSFSCVCTIGKWPIKREMGHIWMPRKHILTDVATRSDRPPLPAPYPLMDCDKNLGANFWQPGVRELAHATSSRPSNKRHFSDHHSRRRHQLKVVDIRHQWRRRFGKRFETSIDKNDEGLLRMCHTRRWSLFSSRLNFVIGFYEAVGRGWAWKSTSIMLNWSHNSEHWMKRCAGRMRDGSISLWFLCVYAFMWDMKKSLWFR